MSWSSDSTDACRFCYVNNVVVGAMHGEFYKHCWRRTDTSLAYLQHDIDRAIIIDFDLHHGTLIFPFRLKKFDHNKIGNGTQALVMPLNAASHAEDLALHAGKPHTGGYGQDGKRRRGWKGFYGSVHDIVSCHTVEFDGANDTDSTAILAK